MVSRLRIDARACVRSRHRDAQCTLCVESCPLDAVALDRAPTIDPDACVECGRCVAACPTGSIHERGRRLGAAADLLRRSAHPVLGCRRHPDGDCGATLECLGSLSLQDLVWLSVEVAKPIHLNATGCGSCEAGPFVVEPLRQQMEELAGAGLFPRGRRPVLVAEALDNEPVDRARRGFFRQIGEVWQRGAVMAENDDLAVSPADIRERLAGRLIAPVWDRFLEVVGEPVRKNERCDECCRCVGTCPVLALERTRVDGKRHLVIDEKRCTACAGCADMCPVDGLDVGALHDRRSIA